MKKISVHEFTLSIPETPNEWELCTDIQGSHKAAKELTEALILAIAAPNYEKARNIMELAMKKNIRYGAFDTEPRTIVEQYLSLR